MTSCFLHFLDVTRFLTLWKDTFLRAKCNEKPHSRVDQAGMASSIFDSFDATPPKPKPPAPTKQRSIFDSYDSTPAATTKPSTHEENKEESVDIPLPSLPAPNPWMVWRKGTLTRSVARRLIREVARHVEQFHGDSVDSPMTLFRRHVHPLISLWN